MAVFFRPTEQDGKKSHRQVGVVFGQCGEKLSVGGPPCPMACIQIGRFTERTDRRIARIAAEKAFPPVSDSDVLC